MVSGVFRSFRHRHFFKSVDDGTLMGDHLEFAAPVPLLGRVVEVLVLRDYLQGFLRERNRFIKEVAETDRWKKYLPS